MDLGRFYYAVHRVVTDAKAIAPVQLLQNVIDALQEISGGQTTAVERFRTQFENLRQGLAKSSLNNARMEVAELLRELGLEHLVGDGLFESAKRELQENQLSPQTAIPALQKLQSEVKGKLDHLTAINKAFHALDVEYDGEVDSDAEIELRIPAGYGKRSLEELSKEAKEWNRDLMTISEVFDPLRTEPMVRALAVGSWVIYLATTAAVLMGLSKCMKEINKILAELVTMRGLVDQLRASRMPEATVKAAEEHCNTIAKTDLTELASRLVDEHYKVQDDGRRAELKTALTGSLKRLAKKLSEGSKVSLRLSPAKRPTVEGDGPDEAQLREIAHADEIDAARAQLETDQAQMIQIEDGANIAQALPPPDAEENDLDKTNAMPDQS